MVKPASSKGRKQQQPRPPSPLDPQLPLVSGRWLAWSLLGIFGGGLVLVYLTVCLLFWQGQWQILFQRTQPVSAMKAGVADASGLELVRFDTTETGQPQLQGLLAPPPAGSPYAATTILYLPATKDDPFTTTTMSLEMFRQIGVGAFTFNYGGTEQDRTEHPSETVATANTEAAWNYLVNTRHVPAGSIILYGRGLGAALAAKAAARHPEAAGLVLDHPLPPALDILAADPRSHGIPLRLLAHDRFDPSSVLAGMQVPKLFLLEDTAGPGQRYAAIAADPKSVLSLGPGSQASAEALKHFLDERDSALRKR